MLSLPLPVKIFWSLAPTDMRKSFDGLSAIVSEQLRRVAVSAVQGVALGGPPASAKRVHVVHHPRAASGI